MQMYNELLFFNLLLWAIFWVLSFIFIWSILSDVIKINLIKFLVKFNVKSVFL